MIIDGSWNDVPAQDVPGHPGVTIRWLIAKNEGAPNFCMRMFELQPGSSTPYHTHDWEHEMFILEGIGEVNDGEKLRPVKKWDFVLIPANDEHNIKNVGDEILRLLCFVPDVEGAC